MITFSVDRHPDRASARRIAALALDWSVATDRDPRRLSPCPIEVDQLTGALVASPAVVTVRVDSRIAGSGRLISWSETDGALVHLAETHIAPLAERPAVEELLLTRLETLARDSLVAPRTVLGANADSDDHERIRLLKRLGYRWQLEMVELELADQLSVRPLPCGVTIRPARRGDAVAIAQLTADNWAGRPYFGGLALEQVSGWLERNDPDLFLLAEEAGRVVGLAVAHIGDRVVEVEDLGVHPNWRRRGLGFGLMTELLDRIHTRTALPVRLPTEGHDPSGALTLYERLGCGIVLRHGRYRKPLQ